MTARSYGVAFVAALAMLAGCAKGPIRGHLALPERAPEPATLNYKSTLFGKKGELWMTLPDGERFAGPYTLDPASPDKSIRSTLLGNRGGTMLCRLTLVEPGVGPDKGGAVRCELSSGGTFAGSF